MSRPYSHKKDATPCYTTATRLSHWITKPANQSVYDTQSLSTTAYAEETDAPDAHRKLRVPNPQTLGGPRENHSVLSQNG